MIKVGNSNIANVKLGETQIQKICKGLTVIWENWKLKTGTLARLYKSGSYGGNNSTVAYSETVPFESETRIVSLNIYTKITRADTNGRQSGRIAVYGITASGNQILLANVTNQWETTSVTSNDTKTAFASIKYDCYLTDDIRRNHKYVFEASVTKWYSKSA